MDTSKWTDAELQRLRTMGDGPADEAVSKVQLRGSVAEVSLFLSNLIQNDTSILDPGSSVQIPPEITEFLAAHTALPPWADPVKIKLGQQLFMRHGPAGLASLLCASLPECYSHKNGTQVLWYTQNLETHTVRRVYQTARIILDVMRPGGLDVGGEGVMSSTKTRLFHAAMRHLILTKPGPDDAPAKGTLAGELLHSDWNLEAWGVPINVEDSIFTLLTFSYVILRSWDRLGCSLSSAEREAYIHCWNVVGYFLGIPAELLPTSWDDAELAFKRLQEHQQAGSPEGVKLTTALRTVMASFVPEPLATHIDHTLMRFLMSDKTADLLGVAEPDALDHAITLGIQLYQIANEGVHAIETIFGTIFRAITGRTASEDSEPALPTRIGQAITELLVALIGRGQHGFDADEIKAKAGEVVNMSSQAGGPIKDELTPVLRADSSLESKHGVASALGRGIVKKLTSPATDPPSAGRRAPRPPTGPGPLGDSAPPAPKRRPYVLPPEFQSGVWLK
ncbi:MAG: oxygenase MpaB family protein [Byssovorax sp.]